MLCDTPPPTPPACNDYCDTITVACQGPLAQYADWSDCHTACTSAQWTVSTSWEAEDSLGCRVTQAQAALTHPADHCEAAGLSGADYCGSWCGVYCALYDAICQTEAPQATGDACVESCLALDPLGPAEIPLTPRTGDHKGANTVQCRLGVLQSLMGTVATMATCEDARVEGGSLCSTSTPSPTCAAPP